MQSYLRCLALALPLLVAACSNAVLSPSSEAVGVMEQELTYRFCTSGQNCAAGCLCDSNQCVPDGFGPANPDCGVRFCSAGNPCAAGCNCVNSQCAPDGFGPPNPDCSAP